MKKQSTNREYNFPDADLYLQCQERIRLAERDIDPFTSYGYDRQRLNKFKELCQQFDELPDDDELLGDQMIATEKKKSSSEILKTAIRSVMTRVAMKYNNRTGRYRKFGTAKMGDMTDAQLLFCGRRVVRVATQLLPFLAETGLTAAHLDKVKEATIAFENALNIKYDRVAERDISVEKRTQIGNVMYRELVVVCNIGKDVWVEKDPVKYEQYVIYESNAEQKRKRKAALKQ